MADIPTLCCDPLVYPVVYWGRRRKRRRRKEEDSIAQEQSTKVGSEGETSKECKLILHESP